MSRAISEEGVFGEDEMDGECRGRGEAHPAPQAESTTQPRTRAFHYINRPMVDRA